MLRLQQGSDLHGTIHWKLRVISTDCKPPYVCIADAGLSLKGGTGSGLQKAMPRLPADSVKKLDDARQGNGLLISAISVREISILHGGFGDTNASELTGATTGTS